MSAGMHTSIWESLTPPRQPAPELRSALNTEIVVVGGGLTGLSAALHLAQSGRKVALIEGRTIGWGGSGRNNGQVIPTLAAMEPAAIMARYGAQAEPFIHMIRDSADSLFEFVRSYKLECDAEQTGWFQPAHSPDYLRLSESRVKAWQAHGSTAELLNKEEGDTLLGSSHWHGGMLNRTGGHVNPLKLSRALARLCAETGVKIFEQTPANSINRHGEGWRISTPHGKLQAGAVLLATNAYTSQNLEPCIGRSIVPLTAYQLASQPLSKAQRAEIIPKRQAISDTRGDLWYFRYSPDHRLVTGAALLIKAGAKPRLQALLKRRLQSAFPSLDPLEFSHVWSGFVGITADFTPRFHALGPNYYSFTGYNGRGIALTLSVGREFARKINGEECALPFEAPRPIPLHSIVRRVARSRLILTRLKDKQPPKV